MADDYTITIKTVLDSSGVKSGTEEATNAVSGFGSSVTSIMEGIIGAHIFESIVEGFKDIVTEAMGSINTLESYAASFNTAMTGASQFMDDGSSSIAGSSSKIKDTLAEMDDAVQSHKEKLAKLGVEIADVMAGQNILDAQRSLNASLISLEENYTQKVNDLQQQITDAYDSEAESKLKSAQNAADTIADMQSSHDNSVADKQEKLADTLAETKSSVAKKALQEQYDEQAKEDEDAFQRQLATKKAQLARDQAEQDAANKDATDKKVASVQAEIDLENKQYDEQKTKLQADSDYKIAEDKKANDEKLKNFQTELDAEERAYKLQITKLKEAAASGGESALSKPIEFGGGDFTAVDQTTKDIMENVEKMKQMAPSLDNKDLLQTAQTVQILGGNVGDILPVLGNYAAYSHQTMDSVLTTFLNAGRGQARALKTLQTEFGITKGDLQNLGVGFDGSTVNADKLFTAYSKIGTTKFGDAISNQNSTLGGSLASIKESISEAGVAFLGYDKATGDVVKGGILDQITSMVKRLVDFLNAHKEEINTFFKNLSTVIGGVSEFLKPLIDDIANFIQHDETLKAIVKLVVDILKDLKDIFMANKPEIDKLIQSFEKLWNDLQPLFKFFDEKILPILTLFAKIILEVVIVAVTSLVNWIDSLINKVNSMINAWNNFGSFLSDLFSGKIANAFNDLKNMSKDATSYVDPTARHSPSLVDKVTSGVGLITDQYSLIANMKLNTPQFSGSTNNSTTQNYNNTTNSPNVNINNMFSVTNQANASNAAKIIAFQLEHAGVV
jgi:phage-related protein